MRSDLRPAAAMECPDIAGGGSNVRPIEHLFRFVEIRDGVDFMPAIRPLFRVVDNRFEGRRAVGDSIRCLERYDETAASGTLVPASGQRSPVPEIQLTDALTERRHIPKSGFSIRQGGLP